MKATSILCGVTGSDGSELAARKAAELAKDSGAKLTYLYVVDVGFLRGLTVELRSEYAEAGLSHLGALILEDAVKLASSLGVDAQSLLRSGRVLDVIAQVCKELGADLIVLGDEGRTATEKLLFGGEVLDRRQELEKATGATILVVR